MVVVDIVAGIALSALFGWIVLAWWQGRHQLFSLLFLIGIITLGVVMSIDRQTATGTAPIVAGPPADRTAAAPVAAATLEVARPVSRSGASTIPSSAPGDQAGAP